MDLYRYHWGATANEYEWLHESSMAAISTYCREGEQHDRVNVYPAMGEVIEIEEQSPSAQP
jgi:hypothetical protein